ncbi:hypothetical protein FRC03_002385 [Tulasnella sp. 419]|nr:hypothetical protein FRC03_002385 [Tulasnella sp. 419]
MIPQNQTSPEVPHSTVPPTPQAGPLPHKRGEIGYDDSHDITEQATEQVYEQYPDRHPADDRPSSAPAPADSTPSGSLPITLPASKYSIMSFLRSPRPNRYLGGLSNPTFIRIVAILVALGGVGAGWYFSLMQLRRSADSAKSGGQPTEATSSIFVHGAFGISTIMLLVILERTVYRARAERWYYLNPDELRQRQLMSETVGASIPYAPWNRPPLPSYAAALGFRGTGDVEDEEIAAPPPPAYGNTRGSTLLLSGIPLKRSGSNRSQSSQEGRNTNRLSALAESFMSVLSRQNSRTNDLEAQRTEQGRRDMLKTLILAETLAKLESNNASASRR